jgi:hypothetical protein
VNFIFPESVHIYSCNRTGRSILEIYKLLIETNECGNWDISFSGNNCFEFSVLCLCSVFTEEAGIGNCSRDVNIELASIYKKPFLGKIRKNLYWIAN